MTSGGAVDERAAALAWAAHARQSRAELREALQGGRLELQDVLGGSDDSVDAVRVLYVLESLPGARKVETRRHLQKLGLEPTTPIRALDGACRDRLMADFPLDG